MSILPACLLCLIAGVVSAATVEPAPPTGWPIEFEIDSRIVTVFTPEIERLDGDRLSARAATFVTVPSAEHGAAMVEPGPVVGMVWLSGRIEAASGADVAVLRSLRVTRSRWPEQAPLADEALSAELAAAVTRSPPTWPLEALGRAADDAERARAAELSAAATRPRIVVAERPTLLLQYDGAPRFGPADEGGLRRALNSDALVVRDPLTVSYWLAAGGGRWFRSSAALGPFVPADEVPAPIRALDDATAAAAPAEEVLVTTEPTALVWSEGRPQWAPLRGTDLLHVTNASLPILRDPVDPRAYLLAAGHWYAASDVSGPWSPIPSEHLPSSFAAIPPDGPAGDVLAHVPGTAAADAGVAAAELPRIATVDPTTVRTPEVRYDGPPRFEPITGTDLRWAANSPQAVVVAQGRYFCCWSGIWYEGPTPQGPWSVASAAPAGIDAIPASSPIYPVRYVRIYHASPTVVHVGYLPGYLGCHRSHDRVVWGRGWHDDHWHGEYGSGFRSGGHGHHRRHHPRHGLIDPIYSRRDDVRPLAPAHPPGDDGRSGSSAGMAPRTDDATGGVYRLENARPGRAPVAVAASSRRVAPPVTSAGTREAARRPTPDRSATAGPPSAGGVAVERRTPARVQATTPASAAPGGLPSGSPTKATTRGERPMAGIPVPRAGAPIPAADAQRTAIQPPAVTRPASTAPVISAPSTPPRSTTPPAARPPTMLDGRAPNTGSSLARPQHPAAGVAPRSQPASTPPRHGNAPVIAPRERPATVAPSQPARVPSRAATPVAPHQAATTPSRSSVSERRPPATAAPRPTAAAPRAELPASAPPARVRQVASDGAQHHRQTPSVPRSSPMPSAPRSAPMPSAPRSAPLPSSRPAPAAQAPPRAAPRPSSSAASPSTTPRAAPNRPSRTASSGVAEGRPKGPATDKR